ncbi:hypothetical protein C8Q79DRAFT_494601 [Trametes meyenii]|nr:hypothetical protein C8Q79DRAFT_494601 [Trametes meyenii]
MDGAEGGVGALDPSLTGEGALDGSRGVGAFVSCRDTLANALNGGFSASGDDTDGDAPHTALSCSPRRVFPLRPDSADRPETLTERSPVRMGSGCAAEERGVCDRLEGMSRDLPLSPYRDALDDVEVVRVRSMSGAREPGSGTRCTSGMRGEACAEVRALRVLGSREGACDAEREGYLSDAEERTVTLSSGELSGSSSSARCPLSL